MVEKNKNITVDSILLLQPTSPIRHSSEIKNAIKLFKKNKLVSMASVSPIKEHPYESVEIRKKNKWRFLKKHQEKIFIEDNNLVKIFIILMEIFI